MAIQVTFDGKTWRTDDLTLDEAVAIEKQCGVSWTNMNPYRSAEQCRAIIVAFVARNRGDDEAAKLVGAMTLAETLDAVTVADDDLPSEFEDGIPKAGAGTATTG